jgi:di/tricarboxylate transporter
MTTPSLHPFITRVRADTLLQHLSDAELARLLGTAEQVTFAPGEVIYQRGHATQGLYLFTQGEALLTSVAPEPIAMKHLRCGEEALAGLKHYLCQAVATSTLHGWHLPRAGLGELTQAHPEIRNNALLALSRYHGDKPVSSDAKRTPVVLNTLSRTELIGWICAIVLPLFIFMLGESLHLSDQASIFTAILTVAVVMWVFSLVDEFIPPLLAVVATLFIGLAPNSVALAGFASPTLMTLLGVFALSATISASGLSYRVIMWLLLKLPDRARWQQSALLLSGYVLSAITPSGNSRFALLLPLYRDMADGLRLPKRGVMGTGLMAAAFSGSMLFSPMMATSKAPNITALGMLPEQVQDQFQGLFWLAAAAVAALAQTLFHFVAMHLIFKGHNPLPLPKERISVQLQLLGPWSYAEKVALMGFVFFLVGASTVSLHHIPPALIAGCVLLGLLLSGVFGKENFRQKLDWPMIFFLLGMDSITRIMRYLGLDVQLAQALSSSYSFVDNSIVLFILAALLTTVVLRLALPTVAGMLVSAIVLIPVAQANGIHPWICIFLVAVFSDIWFAPYQIGVYSQIKSAGLDNDIDNQRFMYYNQWMNVARVAIVFVSVPYWYWLGLL